MEEEGPSPVRAQLNGNGGEQALTSQMFQLQSLEERAPFTETGSPDQGKRETPGEPAGVELPGRG